MPVSLLPSMRADAATELTPAFLQANGIRLLMLDFDNTIVPYTTDVPTDEMAAWLASLLASPVQICVVSNSRKSRVTQFCAARGIPCITRARKPFPRGIRACLARFSVPAAQSALVGDQIYTDTLGANCMGVRSILVPAIHNHTFWLKLRHVAELPFLALSKNRRIQP